MSRQQKTGCAASEGTARRGARKKKSGATFYDAAGSVKRHLERVKLPTVRPLLPYKELFSHPTKVRSLDLAVDSGSINPLFGHHTADHDSFFQTHRRAGEMRGGLTPAKAPGFEKTGPVGGLGSSGERSIGGLTTRGAARWTLRKRCATLQNWRNCCAFACDNTDS
jgi:hypothetical protein